FIGEQVGSRDNFDEFLKQYRLFDDLPTLEIENAHLEILQAMLPDAVKSARNLYVHQLQGDLVDEIEDKLNVHKAKLEKWLLESERQLKLQFEEVAIAKQRKERRQRDIEFVHTQTKEFYETFFQLENDPYLRLLAVFYNA